MRLRTIVAFAFAAPAFAAECPVPGGVQDIFGAPTVLNALAVGVPIKLDVGAVVASETLQVATQVWRLDSAAVMPGAYTFPNNVLVTALQSPDGPRRCLRDVLPRSGPPFLACLSDADGDGAFETAQLYDDKLFYRPDGEQRFKLKRTLALSSPVTMHIDPSGLDHSRVALRKRIRLIPVGDSEATFTTEYGQYDPTPALLFYDPVKGTQTYRRLPIDPATGEPQVAYKGTTKNQQVVSLVDGARIDLGGIGIRIDRRDSGWTAIPLDQRFPDWIAFGCGGTALRVAPSR